MMHSRSFSPAESIGFQRMLDALRRSFETFGFIPHSTSSLVDVGLMQEQTGIKEVYRVNDPTYKLSNMGLRVDHTVCLMQFLERNASSITFPFKRYTTQKVFRPLGENGFREYNSCDIDVVSDKALCLTYDAEIITLISHALKAIGLMPEDKPLFRIQINNRRMMNGYFAQIGISPDRMADVRGVFELGEPGLLTNVVTRDQADALKTLFCVFSGNENTLAFLTELLTGEEAKAGLAELKVVYEDALRLGMNDGMLVINPTMVRKMAYYTGTVCCTHIGDDEKNSVCHGGRYIYGGLSGIGVTFHLPHIFNHLSSHGYFDFVSSTLADVMVSGIGSIEHAMYISTRLRDDGIKTEMLLDRSLSLDEQIAYAKRRGFRLFVWTEGATDRPLKADDLVKVQNLKIPVRPMDHVCWGLFDSLKAELGIRF